jgi:hypothetical protein
MTARVWDRESRVSVLKHLDDDDDVTNEHDEIDDVLKNCSHDDEPPLREWMLTPRPVILFAIADEGKRIWNWHTARVDDVKCIGQSHQLQTESSGIFQIEDGASAKSR